MTDIDATATSPTKVHTSLALIDASATTGVVDILAGATNTSSAGDFRDGVSLNTNITITYTGLTIKGGSGLDLIENDAKHGIVTDGNHANDEVILGGAGRRPPWVTVPAIWFSSGKATLGPMRHRVARSATV